MHLRFTRFFIVAMIAAVLAAGLPAAQGSAAVPVRTDPKLGRVARHAATGKVRFIGATQERPIGRPSALPSNASPEATARAFMNTHGKQFGVRDQARELRMARTEKDGRGRSAVRFQQVHHNVPVLAGELAVNTDGEGNVLSANGEVSPDISLSVQPKIAAGAARQKAVAATAKRHNVKAGSLQSSDPALWIYDARLIGGPGPHASVLVWRFEVTGGSVGEIRQLVLVDAQTGVIALTFNQIAHAKNRKVCDAANSSAQYPCTSPVRTEGQGPKGIADVDRAYDYAGITYDFYKSRFNRDSIDGKGMALIQTVRYCDPASACPYANAFWDGSQMVYGQGYAASDDVVGHELAHGVTERTAGLLYWFQAGAINESLSDVFGELIDQGYDGAYDNDSTSVRWQMGENIPGGAIRSMQNPTLFGHPDKMSSPYYHDGTDGYGSIADSGGVHYNSGVSNKAAYLMTDGGSFNGRTVTALGSVKVAKIYYEATTKLLTSGSDYADLHDALYQGCINLIGVSGITSANCAQVSNATLAVEMNQQPGGNANIYFPAVHEAPVCGPGTMPTNLFYDNMENPASGRWTKMTAAAGTNKWNYTTGYATSGKYSLYAEDQTARSDTSMAQSSAVTIPNGATTYLRFDQAPNFEYGFDYYGTFTAADGGVVEYSANGGAWTDAGSLFTDNGYHGTISPDYDNPLKGRAAFTDVTGGYFSSRMNLSTLAGKSVKFRFRVGTDTGNSAAGFWGWVIDNVSIYTCANKSFGATLSAPAIGARVEGNVTLSASAYGGVALDRVEFLVNNVLMRVDHTAPYSVSWPSTTVTNGTKTISARAVDVSGNVSPLSSRSVTVENLNPVATVPVKSLLLNAQLGTSTTGNSLPTRITWSGSDNITPSTQVKFLLQERVNGGAWISVG
ncbi:MAG: M4 family metallopeptidase, partial [Chloroflexota bacterium]|nr:M4 family metallopeptidase [Chloroflexota bacterium]